MSNRFGFTLLFSRWLLQQIAFSERMAVPETRNPVLPHERDEEGHSACFSAFERLLERA